MIRRFMRRNLFRNRDKFHLRGKAEDAARLFPNVVIRSLRNTVDSQEKEKTDDNARVEGRDGNVISGQKIDQQYLFSSFSKEASTAKIDFDVRDRWKLVLPANLVHLSIGPVYVYSMWTPGMTTALGVVGSAPLDWTHSQVLPVFSAAAVTLGVTTSFLGSWVENSGPRKAGAIGSLFWSAALTTTALGVHTHSLPLVYLGYGLFGGIGWGLMYLAPVTTVMKFFPDRRGLATGIALSAFGAGAALAPTLIDSALNFFFVEPEYIGQLSDISGTNDGNAFVELTTLSDGSQVVSDSSEVGRPGESVIVATAKDLHHLPQITFGPGAYVVGSGDTGTAKALGALGVIYGLIGGLGSRLMKIPHPDWVPISYKERTTTSVKSPRENVVAFPENNVGLEASYVTTNTMQFPLLWLAVFGNATGGLALLSSSKLMMMDIWASLSPSIVSSSFVTGYVSSLGIGMAAGRFGWAAISDKLGRRNTYALFGAGIPIVGLAPSLCHLSIEAVSQGDESSALPMLTTFYVASIVSISFYGGLFSVLPAYIADLFGQKHAGSIHGKALTAWAASAVAGPMGLAYLRSQSEKQAINELLNAIDDEETFRQAFGCSTDNISSIQSLIDAKTISISRLMDFVPDDVVDPTPYLYDSTLHIAAGLMGVAALANFAIRPLDVKEVLSQLETSTTVPIKNQ